MAPEGIEHAEVEANGFRFDLRVAGPPDGRPVLLLHGFPQSSACWEPVMGHLAAAGCRAVAPDQRGYSPGARPDALEAYRLEALVGDVAALVHALGLGPVDLVGHDWGGVVAWGAAARGTELVRSLVAVSTPHPAALLAALRDDEDQRRRSAYIEVFRRPGEAEMLLDAAGLRAMFAATGLPSEWAERHVSYMSAPGVLTAALNWYRALDPSRLDVGPVATPVTYVWSTGDVAFGRAAAEATAAYVRGPYDFVELEAVSHWVPEEVPDTLAQTLAAHLSRS